MRKIKVKANELRDADVSFISLVTRPANRIPFRAMKAETDESQTRREGMIHFKSMFTSKEEATPEVSVAAIVCQKTEADQLVEVIKEHGFSVEDRIEDEDGMTIFKQEDYDVDKVVAVKMSDSVAVLFNHVEKAFTSYPDSKDFDENLKAAGFYPSVGLATDALVETVKSIMYEGTSPKDVTKKIESALTGYSDFVMGLTSALPTVAFKLDGVVPAAKEEAKDEEDEDKAAVTADAETSSEEVAKDDASADADDKAAKADDESDVKAEETAKSDEGEGETVDTDDKAAAKEDGSDKEVVKEDSEEEANPLVEMFASFKADLTEKLDSLTSSVDALKTKADENADRIEQVEATAKSAETAVKGTVVADSDFVPSESLGNLGRTMTKSDKDTSVWDDSPLDGIVG